MIKAIVFDYFGVISLGSIILSYVKKNIPSPESRLETLNTYSDKWDIGEIDYQGFNKILSEITDIPSDSIWPTFFGELKPFDEVINIIKSLKKHYKIILLSNSCSGHIRRLLKNQNIENLFDEIIISAEHKMMKPDPKFYELMLSIAKINASEAVFVDDRIKNVDAGNNLGIKSFLFTDAQKLVNDLKSQNIII